MADQVLSLLVGHLRCGRQRLCFALERETRAVAHGKNMGAADDVEVGIDPVMRRF